MREKLVLKNHIGTVIAIVTSSGGDRRVEFANSRNLQLALEDFLFNGVDVQRYSDDSVLRITAGPSDTDFLEKLSLYFQLSFDYYPIITQSQDDDVRRTDLELACGVWSEQPLVPTVHSETFHFLLDLTDKRERELLRNLVLGNWIQNVIHLSESSVLKIDEDVASIPIWASKGGTLFESNPITFEFEPKNLFERLTTYLTTHLRPGRTGNSQIETDSGSYVVHSPGQWHQPNRFFDISQGFQFVPRPRLTDWNQMTWAADEYSRGVPFRQEMG